MAPNTRLEVEIKTLGGRGDGVADTPRGRVYVPYTLPGDRVGVRLGAAAGDGHAAELVELIASGPARIEPPCRHFHDCGGCALQHVAADFYADWKREQVIAALRRRDLPTDMVAPLVRVPPQDRRRADLVARKVGRQLLLGFHRRGSHKIVDLAECPVLQPALVVLFEPLRALLAGLLPAGAAVEAKLTLTDNGVDLLLDGLAATSAAARETLAAFAETQDLARLVLRDRDAGFEDPIARRRAPLLRFGGVAVELPPAAFLQASPAAEAAMAAEVLAAALGAGRIADLYAGLGTFGLPLSATAEVQAYESEARLIAALQAAANRARRRLKAELRDLVRRPLDATELNSFDAVVFDPPRAGAREQAAELAKSKVPLVVGVSCAPGTFARDARLLVDGGYRLTRVLPVDQFLWSPHVELVATFRR